MKELTKAEEQLMQILWEIERGFVKDILQKLDDPKPAYNTVSTIVRILEKKGFVDHSSFGNTHEYFPIVSKEEYTKKYMKNFVTKYFQNSYKQLVSFFTKENDLSLSELEEMKRIVEQQIKNKKEAQV